MQFVVYVYGHVFLHVLQLFEQITAAGGLDHTNIKIVCYAWNSCV